MSLVYTPDQTDSVITGNEVKDNSILINGSVVRSLDNSAIHAAHIVTNNQYHNGDDVWDVLVKDTHIGTIRLHGAVSIDSMHLQNNAGVQETWIGGSTNSALGRMIYDKDASPLSAQTSRGDGGVEESSDTDTNTSRINTFHAATAFAEGDSVGKATQHGASPFLITMGDPLLSRQTPNKNIDGTTFDAGQ